MPVSHVRQFRVGHDAMAFQRQAEGRPGHRSAAIHRARSERPHRESRPSRPLHGDLEPGSLAEDLQGSPAPTPRRTNRHRTGDAGPLAEFPPPAAQFQFLEAGGPEMTAADQDPPQPPQPRCLASRTGFCWARRFEASKGSGDRSVPFNQKHRPGAVARSTNHPRQPPPTKFHEHRAAFGTLLA